MIRFACRYKYTITMCLVFAGLLTWCAWDGDWRRLVYALLFGLIGAARVAVPDLLKLWDHKRRRVTHGRR